MGIFTDGEIKYMAEQRLGRLATVTKKGDPHVIPVNYMYNPEHECIDIIGKEMTTSLKYKNIVGFPRASFVVDDVVSLMPYRTRLLHIRGAAEIVIRKEDDPLPTPPSAPKMTPEMIRLRNRTMSPEMIRIRVEKIVAAGLADDPAEMISRTIAPDGTVLGMHRYIQPYGGGEKRPDQVG
ncbi:MAG: pyridoxamine 5-phosphate oxidase family protein [Mycobacteriales bacterium]|jgi:pyridoxamine 5'-phosphate oxidase family protein